MSNRLKNIMSEGEYNDYISYTQEYLENFVNQEIYFYKVNRNQISKNEVFNEANLNQTLYDDPINIKCLVEIKLKNNKSYGQKESGRYEEYGNIYVHILEKTIENNNINIEYGDIMAYYVKNNYVFFEVTDTDTKNISNQKTFGTYKVAFKIIEGTPVNENQILSI